MTPFTLTPAQHRNLLICMEELNQIDQEVDFAEKCKIPVDPILKQELENNRQRVHDYLKTYSLKEDKSSQPKTTKKQGNREIL